jgi:hypothetical protein
MNPTELKVLRGVVATIWLVTAALTFGLYPVEDSILLLEDLHLPRDRALLVVYAGALLDLAMGMLTLARPARILWLCQIAIIVAYSVLATLMVPEY